MEAAYSREQVQPMAEHSSGLFQTRLYGLLERSRQSIETRVGQLTSNVKTDYPHRYCELVVLQLAHDSEHSFDSNFRILSIKSRYSSFAIRSTTIDAAPIRPTNRAAINASTRRSLNGMPLASYPTSKITIRHELSHFTGAERCSRSVSNRLRKLRTPTTCQCTHPPTNSIHLIILISRIHGLRPLEHRIPILFNLLHFSFIHWTPLSRSVGAAFDVFSGEHHHRRRLRKPPLPISSIRH